MDAINATDNAAAHAHCSNVAMAVAMARLGAEPIMQVVCRDKNRLALQSDIVGASMFGVENICCLTGDDVTAGDEPGARRVFDLDGPQLVRLAMTLAPGTYLSGRRLDPAPHLFVGAVENPAAPPVAYRAERTVKKLQAGARFFQLQICSTRTGSKRSWREVVRLGVADPGGVPADRVPGARCARAAVHARARARHRRAGRDDPRGSRRPADPCEEAYQVVLEQARHALAQPGVRGIHITDFRHDDSVGRIVSDLGLASRRQHRAARAATRRGEQCTRFCVRRLRR